MGGSAVNSKVAYYCALLFKLLELREYQDAGQDLSNQEDALLEEMDRAWLRLNLDEIAAVEEMAKLLKRPRRPRLGHGIFSFAEAGRLTRLTSSRIREWFDRPTRPSMFAGDYESVDGDRTLSFLDLIDVLIAGKLRDAGVSLQSLRRVYDRMKDEVGVHPFARNLLLTDGVKVFLKESEGEDAHVYEVLSGQEAFPRVIAPYLKQIRYSEVTRLAERWDIASGIVVDPRIFFGKPVVLSSGQPTHIIARAYAANGSSERAVAAWFGITEGEITAAVNFEQEHGEAA